MITRQERCHGRKTGKGRKLRQRISGVSTPHRLSITGRRSKRGVLMGRRTKQSLEERFEDGGVEACLGSDKGGLLYLGLGKPSLSVRANLARCHNLGRDTSPLPDATWYCSLREIQRTFVVATAATMYMCMKTVSYITLRQNSR